MTLKPIPFLSTLFRLQLNFMPCQKIAKWSYSWKCTNKNTGTVAHSVQYLLNYDILCFRSLLVNANALAIIWITCKRFFKKDFFVCLFANFRIFIVHCKVSPWSIRKNSFDPFNWGRKLQGPAWKESTIGGPVSCIDKVQTIIKSVRGRFFSSDPIFYVSTVSFPCVLTLSARPEPGTAELRQMLCGLLAAAAVAVASLPGAHTQHWPWS